MLRRNLSSVVLAGTLCAMTSGAVVWWGPLGFWASGLAAMASALARQVTRQFMRGVVVPVVTIAAGSFASLIGANLYGANVVLQPQLLVFGAIVGAVVSQIRFHETEEKHTAQDTTFMFLLMAIALGASVFAWIAALWAGIVPWVDATQSLAMHLIIGAVCAGIVALPYVLNWSLTRKP